MSSQAGSGAAPLDLAGLKQLYGEETVKELLQMSVGEARGLLVQLDEGIAAKDDKAVAAVAHQLKGLASTMTIDTMATASFEVEKAVKQGQWEQIADKTVSLKNIFQSLETYVTKVLKEFD